MCSFNEATTSIMGSLCISPCFAIVFFVVFIYSLHEHHTYKEYSYIKINEKHCLVIQIMEFIDNECSVSSDTSSQKSTTEDEKPIDESSLDSYDSSFIDDPPSETSETDDLPSETNVTESSEKQTDKVCKL